MAAAAAAAAAAVAAAAAPKNRLWCWCAAQSAFMLISKETFSKRERRILCLPVFLSSAHIGSNPTSTAAVAAASFDALLQQKYKERENFLNSFKSCTFL